MKKSILLATTIIMSYQTVSFSVDGKDLQAFNKGKVPAGQNGPIVSLTPAQIIEGLIKNATGLDTQVNVSKFLPKSNNTPQNDFKNLRTMHATNEGSSSYNVDVSFSANVDGSDSTTLANIHYAILQTIECHETILKKIKASCAKEDDQDVKISVCSSSQLTSPFLAKVFVNATSLSSSLSQLKGKVCIACNTKERPEWLEKKWEKKDELKTS